MLLGETLKYQFKNYVDLADKYSLKVSVFEKSLITDSRINEIVNIDDLMLSSADAVKGDAILDLVVLNHSKTLLDGKKETKESLNSLRKDYCNNNRLAGLMRKTQLYNRIDCGNNGTALTDQTAATSFEALIYNIYIDHDIGKVESFLEEIDFYTFAIEKKQHIHTDNELIDYLSNQIEILRTVKLDDLNTSSENYIYLYETFIEAIDRILEFNGIYIDDVFDKLDYVSSRYSIETIDGKSQKNYLNKYIYIIKCIYDIMINVKNLNHKDIRLLLHENDIRLRIKYLKLYNDNYFISYLSKVTKRPSTSLECVKIPTE